MNQLAPIPLQETVAQENEQSLAQRLESRLGALGVLISSSDREPYERAARHCSGQARMVVRPTTTDELAWVIQEVTNHGAPMLIQGAATGLVAGATPRSDGSQVVISMQRLREVLEVNQVNRSVTVSAGYRLSDVNRIAADYGLTFPIDLGSDPTIGGMVATNTGGARLIRYGGVRENLLDLEAVLAHPAGQKIGGSRGLRKDNTGLNWAQLLCGTFGAFGVVTQATLKLHALPRQIATALLAVRSPAEAMGLVCRLEDFFGDFISACEGISANAMGAVVRHGVQSPFQDEHPYYLLIELTTSIPPDGKVDLNSLLLSWLETEMESGSIRDAAVDKPSQLWRLRHMISEAVQATGKMVAFDVALPRSRFAAFLEQSIALATRVVPGTQVYDFGHLGDGGVHLNMIVPPETSTQDVQVLRDRVYALVVEDYSGSFSAEHGIGPYNQRWYQRYAEMEKKDFAAALHAYFDPRGHLGHVRLD